LAPSGASLVMARSAKPWLQRIVGAGDVRPLIAMKKTGPVALGHLTEVPQHGREGGTAALLVVCPSPAPRPQVALALRALELGGMGKPLGRPFAPALGRADQRPQRRCWA
jgi:hypothetical protein